MLWGCELKSKSWWTDNLSFINLSVDLLHTLAVWQTEARCPHYFISNCNLVDKTFALQLTASQLFLIDRDWVLSWFVNSYIKNSVQICPESVLRLFDDVGSSTELRNAVSAVADWRLNTTTKEKWHAFEIFQLNIPAFLSGHTISTRSYVCWMTKLPKTDKRLPLYFTAYVFLHVAHKILLGGLVDQLMNVPTATTSELVLASNHYNEHTFSLLNKVSTTAGQYQQLGLASTLTDRHTSELVELLTCCSSLRLNS